MKVGEIYLIHFDKAFHHARHYIGFTTIGERRHKRHELGQGLRLLRAVAKAGIKFEVVRTWEGDRHLERKLKNGKNSKRLCPICKKEG